MDALRTTEAHYIKCIKSNHDKVPDVFDSQLVMQQLAYSGVLEVVRIRKEGYSVRQTFCSVIEEFPALARSLHSKLSVSALSEEEVRELVRKICSTHLSGDSSETPLFQLGKELVFFKSASKGLLQSTEQMYLQSAAVKVQKKLRVWRARRQCDALRSAEESRKQVPFL